MGNKIQLFGELESVAVDKKLVDAVQVKDSAWIDPTTKEVSEETQSAINAALKQMAEDAAKTASDLKLDYDPVEKQLKLYIGEGNSKNPISSISSSDFTKDGMIETVLGPVTPVYDDLTDKGAAVESIPTAIWVVAEDTGEQAFFAFDVDIPSGYLRIQEITLGNTYLGFIWNTNTDAGKPEGKVYDSKNFKASALDVSKLADVYTAGKGLDLKDNQFSIRLGGQSEGYLKFDGNDYLVIQGVDKKITDTVEDAKTDLQSSIDSLKERVSTNEGAIQSHGTALSGMTAKITKVESDYKEADAALLGETDDPTDADTIHGVRNYATQVARSMGGYNIIKTVTSGTTVKLYANPKSSETTNIAGLMIDRASISVLVGNLSQTEVEVGVQKGADGTVTLSWSGITPDTEDNRFTVSYRVITTPSVNV